MKNTKSEIKLIIIGKQAGTMYCFGCKGYTQNFRPEKVKMTNKVLKEKSHVLFADQISRGFENKNATTTNNYTLYKLML